MIGDYRPECDIPGVSGKVLDAAKLAVHTLKLVLTLLANNRPLLPTKNGDPKAAAALLLCNK
jgi:hypothetical protein